MKKHPAAQQITRQRPVEKTLVSIRRCLSRFADDSTTNAGNPFAAPILSDKDERSTRQVKVGDGALRRPRRVQRRNSGGRSPVVAFSARWTRVGTSQRDVPTTKSVRIGAAPCPDNGLGGAKHS